MIAMSRWVIALACYTPVISHACDETLTRNIPPRSSSAITASDLLERLTPMSERERTASFAAELMAGNLPEFLRRVIPVTLHRPAAGHPARVIVCVLPDYLAIGSNDDFVFAPLTIGNALAVAQRYGFVLPTRGIVDAVYREAAVRLRPQPLPASEVMRSVEYVWRHHLLVRAQAIARGAPLGALTAGHKKDVVLTDRLRPTPARVAIYGWHRGMGDPIQPLSTVHGERYADYSHGVRLVSSTAYVDGEPRPIGDVLMDPELALSASVPR